MYCDSICIAEWIFLFLWFVSVPTYCMVIYTIWKHRKTKFKEEFWTLTMALFPADMLLLCQTMWAFKMAMWGLLPSALSKAPKVVGWLIIVPYATFKCAQEMGVLFLSLNRYITIAKPDSALWDRKVTIRCIWAQWIVALVMALCHAPAQFNLHQNLENNSSGFLVVPDESDNRMVLKLGAALSGLMGLVRFVLFIALYGHMFYSVYKQKRVVNPKQNRAVNRDNKSGPSTRSHAKFNLIIIGACLALCDMACTLNTVDMATHMDEMREKARYLSFRHACLTDIYGWINGWLMLACASAVRKQFLKQYGCVKSNK